MTHNAENDCHYCGRPLGDASDSEDHACPCDNAVDHASPEFWRATERYVTPPGQSTPEEPA